DTYGFPVDLTADICRERNVPVDLDGFEKAMGRQREQARAGGKFKATEGLSYSGVDTRFERYERLQSSAKITARYAHGTAVDAIEAGQAAIVVLDTTPFYAESGGQVGDTGLLTAGSIRFEVSDTQKIQNGVFGHHGRLVEGRLTVGAEIEAQVDAQHR